MELDFIKILTSILAVVTSVTAVSVFYKSLAKHTKSNKFDPFSQYTDEIKRINEILNQSQDLSVNSEDKKFILFKEYHAQSLAQSRISFWFSIVFASIGFFIIVISILTAIYLENNTVGSIISLISGIVMEAVSALFFVQSNKSRELMSSFFDKLRTDRKLEDAIILANQIPDEQLQSKIKVILSLNFAEVTTTDEILGVVLKELK